MFKRRGEAETGLGETHTVVIAILFYMVLISLLLMSFMALGTKYDW